MFERDYLFGESMMRIVNLGVSKYYFWPSSLPHNSRVPFWPWNKPNLPFALNEFISDHSEGNYQKG